MSLMSGASALASTQNSPPRNHVRRFIIGFPILSRMRAPPGPRSRQESPELIPELPRRRGLSYRNNNAITSAGGYSSIKTSSGCELLRFRVYDAGHKTHSGRKSIPKATLSAASARLINLMVGVIVTKSRSPSRITGGFFIIILLDGSQDISYWYFF